jgi:hypothetical protein
MPSGTALASGVGPPARRETLMGLVPSLLLMLLLGLATLGLLALFVIACDKV